MNNVFSIRILAALSLGLASMSVSAQAASCSKEDVDHYLQSGFTHEQVVKLCTKSNTATTVAPPVVPSSQSQTVAITAQPQVVAAPIAAAPTQSTQPAANEEAMFFKLAISAKSVDVQADKLVYVAKECLKFGIEDMMGEKDELCRDIKTSVNYKGLKIIRANPGIFLISKRELIVGGNIKRELVEPSNIPERFKKDFFEDFVTSPDTINIPVRDSIDPHEVGQKLAMKAS